MTMLLTSRPVERRPWRARALHGAAVVVAAVVVVVAGLAVIGALALWQRILLVLAAVVAWSVWATRPVDVPLHRHLAALAGQVVLDAVRAVLRTLVMVVVVVALLVAGWSWLAPRLVEQVDTWRRDAVHQVLTGTLDTATSHVPVPPVADWWNTLTSPLHQPAIPAGTPAPSGATRGGAR